MWIPTSKLTSPSKYCYQLQWLQITFFLVLSISTMVSCTIKGTPYSKHCASVVRESTPNVIAQFATIPFPLDQDGYFFGREGMLYHPNSSQYHYSPSRNRGTILFRTSSVYSTDVDDVYKVEASLRLQIWSMSYYTKNLSNSYSSSPRVIPSESLKGPMTFELEGFWSKSTGKICMVGSSSTYSGGKHVLAALLKLTDVKPSSSITGLITGTLESLSSDESSYFEPFSLLMFPQMNYKYTEVLKEFDSVCTGAIDVPRSLSLSLTLGMPICSLFSGSDDSFKLEYSSTCRSAKTCNTPFGKDAGYLPEVMYLRLIQCAEDRQHLRFLIQFPTTSYAYDHPFDPSRTLVAEGSWDTKKNQLCVVACRISNAINSLNGSHVEDCSVRLSLRLPVVWSIRNTSGMVGHIWSNKHANDSGYFDRIMFRSTLNYYVFGVPGLKYEYTVVDEARNSCPDKKQCKDDAKQYPDENSNDLRFDVEVKNSKGNRVGVGSFDPVFVGDQIAPQSDYKTEYSTSWATNSLVERNTNHSIPLNISYKMSFPSLDPSSVTYVQISAEGIYDAETGSLCMVGCGYLESINQIAVNDSMDCNILVNLQFPHISSNSLIQGSIQSTRDQSSPLYFEPHSFSAAAYSSHHSRDSIWRMDLEIIVALISNTLGCVFVGYQILYVKKHRSVLPFISLLMLLVLTLGHMMPLMLNFEALFFQKENSQKSLQRTGGWLQVNEVITRVVMMVAFLLQIRLLQLIWSARLADGKQKAFLAAEKRTLCVLLPLYLSGCLISVYVNWRSNKLGEGIQYTYSSNYQHSLWVDLRSYAGLLLDGFLVPQILLNIFHNSREKALSHFFYGGTTFVRLLPHAYDLYRSHYYVEDFDGSYMYANPGAEYYSTAWDVIIPFGGLLFAAIIYLQQRFSGRFFMSKSYKELEGCEKIPVVGDA